MRKYQKFRFPLCPAISYSHSATTLALYFHCVYLPFVFFQGQLWWFSSHCACLYITLINGCSDHSQRSLSFMNNTSSPRSSGNAHKHMRKGAEFSRNDTGWGGLGIDSVLWWIWNITFCYNKVGWISTDLLVWVCIAFLTAFTDLWAHEQYTLERPSICYKLWICCFY